jgi:hypothetical protein
LRLPAAIKFQEEKLLQERRQKLGERNNRGKQELETNTDEIDASARREKRNLQKRFAQKREPR